MDDSRNSYVFNKVVKTLISNWCNQNFHRGASEEFASCVKLQPSWAFHGWYISVNTLIVKYQNNYEGAPGELACCSKIATSIKSSEGGSSIK